MAAKGRYDKPPVIEEKGPKAGAEKAKSSTGITAHRADPPSSTKGSDPGPKPDIGAGDASVPVTMHALERDHLHGKHAGELMDMHHRHQHEHRMRESGQHQEKHEAMASRHHAERRALHTAHEKEFRDVSNRQAGGGMLPEDGEVGEK
jgi:hypothetical protein